MVQDRWGSSQVWKIPTSGAHVTAGTEANFYEKKRSELRRQLAHGVVFNQRRLTTEIWRSQNLQTSPAPLYNRPIATLTRLCGGETFHRCLKSQPRVIVGGNRVAVHV